MGGTLVALVALLLFQAAGQCAARAVFPRESAGARLLLGSTLGSGMLHWFPVLFSFFFGFSLVAHACAALLAVLLGGLCLALSQGGDRPALSAAFSAFSRRKFLWCVLALWLFFCFLAWKGFLFENGRIYSSQATYGDMSMHLSFLTSIARQGGFPPDYPLLPGRLLSYPFLSDSISSSLLLLGAPLRLAYLLPMFLAGAQVFFGFFLFASALLQQERKAALAWLLFFFNGGLGFLYFLGGGADNFTRMFTAFYETPTNLIGENIRWVNVVVDMLLPQRATLFGWALLFPALYLLYRAVFAGERRYFLWAGVLAGLLPMIHTHSFLALGLVCAAWLAVFLLRGLSRQETGARLGKGLVLLGLPLMALLQAWLRAGPGWDAPGLFAFALVCGALFVLLLALLLLRYAAENGWRRLCATWLVLLAAALALALPQLFFWTFRQAGEGGFVRGHFGWAIGDEPYLLFYLKNLGLTGLLALGGLLCAGAEDFGKTAPALLLWFVAEFVEFQPNDYDNNKLLYVAYAFLCCAAAEFACRLLGKIRRAAPRRALAALGLALCAVSALLTMGRETVARYELFGEGAVALAGFAEENTPAGAVFLTDTRHNNEIAALAGRHVVCGSPSYLYFHGLPYYENERAVQAMYERPEESRELFRRYRVAYVLVSDFERSSYRVDEEALARLFIPVYAEGSRTLYQVH